MPYAYHYVHWMCQLFVVREDPPRQGMNIWPKDLVRPFGENKDVKDGDPEPETSKKAHSEGKK